MYTIREKSNGYKVKEDFYAKKKKKNQNMRRKIENTLKYTYVNYVETRSRKIGTILKII